jgi:hypothetical protein
MAVSIRVSPRAGTLRKNVALVQKSSKAASVEQSFFAGCPRCLLLYSRGHSAKMSVYSRILYAKCFDCGVSQGFPE